jgi:hypothetical protein
MPSTSSRQRRAHADQLVPCDQDRAHPVRFHRFHRDRGVPAGANKLCKPVRIVPICLVGLQLQSRCRPAGMDTIHRYLGCAQLVPEPNCRRPRFHSSAGEIRRPLRQRRRNRSHVRRNLSFSDRGAGANHANRGFPRRNVQSGIVRHRSSSSSMTTQRSVASFRLDYAMWFTGHPSRLRRTCSRR